MPSPTYVALAKTVLTGNQATITFSPIPNTYTDLVVVVSARRDGIDQRNDITLKVNSISSAYSQTYIYTSTATPISGRQSSQSLFTIWNMANGASSTSNTFSNVEFYIPNYAGSTNKVVSITGVQENNSTTDNYWGIIAEAGLLGNTAAITELTIQAGASNFVSGSRFDLYGIKNS